MEELLQEKWSIHYIGMNDGPEKRIIEQWNKKNVQSVSFHGIETGNIDVISVLKHSDVNIYSGYREHLYYPKFNHKFCFPRRFCLSPSSICCSSTWNTGTHESDISIGLANKLINRIATKIYTSFPSDIKTLSILVAQFERLSYRAMQKKDLEFVILPQKLRLFS